eukprot:PhM_4_TR1480/c0_g1_i1/m.56177
MISFALRRRGVRQYTKILRDWGALINLLFIFATVYCCFPASALSKHLTQSMAPPSGSQSEKASKMLSELFPAMSTSTPFLIFSRSIDHTSLEDSLPFLLFDGALQRTVMAYNGTVSYGSYPTSMLMFPEKVSHSYLSRDNTSQLAVVSFQYDSTDDRTVAFSSFLEETVANLTAIYFSHSAITSVVLSTDSFMDEVVATVQVDITRMATIVVPMYCIAFVWWAASVRFLILPICVLIFSLSATLAICTALAVSVVPMTAIAPAVITFFTLACVTNNSVLLITAYRREVIRHLQNKTMSSLVMTRYPETSASVGLDDREIKGIVDTMLLTSGWNEITSTFVLSICLIGMSVIPLDVLRSLGAGCLVSVIVVMFASLILIPTLLVHNGQFFLQGIQASCVESLTCERCSCLYGEGDDEEGNLTPRETSMQRFGILRGSGHPALMYRQSIHYKIALLVTTFPYNVIAIGLVLALLGYPMFMGLQPVTLTNDISLILPRGSHGKAVWNEVTRYFTPGHIFMYKLVFELKDYNASTLGVFETENFASLHSILADISNTVPNTPCDSISSFAYDQNCNILTPLDLYIAISECQKKTSSCIGQELYNAVLANMFSQNQTRATWALVKLHIDPYSTAGHEWYHAMVDRIEGNYSKNSPFRVGLSGSAAETLDTISMVKESFPTYLGGIMGGLFVVMILAFHSVVTALRVTFSVWVTIGTVWGLANMVYLDGGLSGLGMAGLGRTTSIIWLAPFSAIMICMRLCVDFDLMDFLQITNYVLTYGTTKTIRSSIRRGLADTGPGSFAAGMFTAWSFAGLLFSDLPLLNQLGFYLVATALIQVTIIRAVLSPALVSVLGVLNWVPRRLVSKNFRVGLPVPAFPHTPLRGGGGGGVSPRESNLLFEDARSQLFDDNNDDNGSHEDDVRFYSVYGGDEEEDAEREQVLYNISPASRGLDVVGPPLTSALRKFYPRGINRTSSPMFREPFVSSSPPAGHPIIVATNDRNGARQGSLNSDESLDGHDEEQIQQHQQQQDHLTTSSATTNSLFVSAQSNAHSCENNQNNNNNSNGQISDVSFATPSDTPR